MRKVFIFSMVLTLSIILVVSVALPAAAKAPNDNQPVAWVTWGGSNANSKLEMGVHQQASILVKQLADGSTIGHFDMKNFTTGESQSWPLLDSDFRMVGNAKVANILSKMADPAIPGSPEWYFWWQLSDLGEPGVGNDTYQMFAWTEYVGPLPGEIGYPGGLGNPLNYAYASDPLWPPSFNFPPSQTNKKLWIPYSGPSPIALASGNIQVHLAGD
jgi:hypothetical protein